ncbi:hypothetical protein EDD16DRAFT_1796807 [Pisolithus croceorrhizus]|nr:hypothetical protein EDD16DRAFT_1796807 [Pisolithus croceorrhizus]
MSSRSGTALDLMPPSFRAVKIPDLPFGKQPPYPRIGEEEPSLHHLKALNSVHRDILPSRSSIPSHSKRYTDEIADVVVEGIARCKTDKDVWGAVKEWCGVDNENYQGTSRTWVSPLCNANKCPATPSLVGYVADEARNVAIAAFDGGEGLVEQDMRDHFKRIKPSIKHKTDERVPYPEPVVMLSAQEHALHFINILMTAKQAVRPKSSIPKSIEEATKTVDDVFNVSIQIQVDLRLVRQPDGLTCTFPEPVVVLFAQEHLGPSQGADEEFAKELAQTTTEPPYSLERSTRIMRVSSVRKKRVGETEKNIEGDADHPNGSDKVEQQHLKQLVLNCEQTEEVEELKALAVRPTFQCKTRLASLALNKLTRANVMSEVNRVSSCGIVGITESFEASGGPQLLVHDPDREPRLPVSPTLDGAGRSPSSASNVDCKYWTEIVV